MDTNSFLAHVQPTQACVQSSICEGFEWLGSGIDMTMSWWHAHGSTHPAECRCPFPVWWFNIHWTQVPVCLPTLFWAHHVLFKSLQISCIYEDWRNFKFTWMWSPQLPDTLPKYNVYRQNCLSLNRLDWVIECNLILLTLSNGKCKRTCWQNIFK